MTVSNWSFTKVVVADLEAQAAFYSGVFGLQEANRITAEVGGEQMEEVFFETKNATPVLGFVSYPGLPAPSPGETVIGFSTPDIAALFERAREHGGKIKQEPMNSEQTLGYTIGLLEDPEGHSIEVIETSA